MIRVGILVGVAALIAATLSGPVRAQTDDGPTSMPSTSAVPFTSPGQLIHHHGGGDDGDAPRPSFRDDRSPSAGMRLESEAGTGLAMDKSPLPGELGATPESRQPLFSKSAGGLAQRPDAWDNSGK